MTAAVAVALLVGSGRMSPRRPGRRRSPAPPDPLLLPRLLVVALSAGLPLTTALAVIARLVPGPAGDDADVLVRAARRGGLAPALAAHGDLLDGLPRRLARAHLTGAAMSDAVRAHVHEVSDRRRAAALTRARTLPTRLLVPIALLLLPGFVALVVVPPLVEELGGFLGPLAGP